MPLSGDFATMSFYAIAGNLKQYILSVFHNAFKFSLGAPNFLYVRGLLNSELSEPEAVLDFCASGFYWQMCDNIFILFSISYFMFKLHYMGRYFID